MKKTIDLTKVVDEISTLITCGLDINIDSKSTVKKVQVSNPRNGREITFTFKVPYIGVCNIVDWEETPEKPKGAVDETVKP